jgi:predicted nucleotidyltransferase
MGEKVAGARERQTRDFFDEETRKVVEILKRADPEKIIRFGSSVWGPLGTSSDLDLCVLKRLEDSPIREKQKLRRLLSKYHYDYPVDIDLHVYSPDEYEDRLKRGDFFLKEIERGEVVYARE